MNRSPFASATVRGCASTSTASSDAQLVALIADSSRDALGELYRRHAGWVLARLRHRCADDGLVAEALQDTFVAVWRGASGYDGRGAVPAWLWGIAIRRLIGLLRKRTPVARCRRRTRHAARQRRRVGARRHGAR